MYKEKNKRKDKIMEEILRFQQYMLLIRKAVGWTAEEFGKQVGVTRQTINNLEKNNREKFKLTKTQYIAMRSVLDVEITIHPETTETLQLILNVAIDHPEKYMTTNKQLILDKINMNPIIFKHSLFTKDLANSISDIFNTALASGTEGAKYDVGAWLIKIVTANE